MATRHGNQTVFTKVASGNLPAERLATISGNNALLATSGQLAYPISHRADNGQHVGLVDGGHAKIYAGVSISVGNQVMAGGDGFAVVAASGQFVVGQALSAADSGTPFEVNVHISQKSLA